MFFRVLHTLLPMAVGAQQPATINPTLELCTTYPLRSLPNTSTHDQHWESNPKPSDLESNISSTWPHTPTSMRLYLNIRALEVNCNIFLYRCTFNLRLFLKRGVSAIGTWAKKDHWLPPGDVILPSFVNID